MSSCRLRSCCLGIHRQRCQIDGKGTARMSQTNRSRKTPTHQLTLWTLSAVFSQSEGNGNLQTLICVPVARPRQCHTLPYPVPWQNWMAAYLGYTLCGWRCCFVADQLWFMTHIREEEEEESDCGYRRYVSVQENSWEFNVNLSVIPCTLLLNLALCWEINTLHVLFEINSSWIPKVSCKAWSKEGIEMYHI